MTKFTLHSDIESKDPARVKNALKTNQVINDAVDIQGDPDYDKTTINHAIRSDIPEIVSLVLNAGAKINKTHCNRVEGTLVTAIKKGNPEIVELILKAGAKVDNTSNGKMRTLDLAIESQENDIIDLALLYGASPESLTLNSFRNSDPNEQTPLVHPRKQEMEEIKTHLDKCKELKMIESTSSILTVLSNMAARDKEEGKLSGSFDTIPLNIINKISTFSGKYNPESEALPEELKLRIASQGNKPETSYHSAKAIKALYDKEPANTK